MDAQGSSRAAVRERVVFFEPEIGGHQWYHVRYLLSALLEEDWGFAADFLLHPDLAHQMEGFLAGVASPTPVQTIALSLGEVAAATCRPLWLRALRRWRLAKRYLGETVASHWHFMCIDEMQVPLSLGYRLSGDVTVSGVLFRPSVHYASHGTRPRLRERLRDLRKLIAYRRMLNHPRLAVLFCLDQLFPDYAHAVFASGSKVLYLPDPIPTTQAHGSTMSRPEAIASAPLGRTRFLMFGALQARKGILETLEALRRLPACACVRLAVLFAGRLEPEIRSSFVRRLQELRETRPSLWVQVIDRFVEDQELRGLLDWCDIVLAPYQRFVGSSGVLIWAAAARRPVVTQDYGLLGILTTRYRLGVTVDSTDPGQLAAVLTRLALDPQAATLSRSGCEEFIRGRAPSAFARVVLEGIRAARSARHCRAIP